MDRQQVFDFAKQRYGTEPDYPWRDENAGLRHDDRKWYAVVLKVGRDKLGLEGNEIIDVINLKCDPLLIGSLCTQDGFHRAYHMNKEKWISIRLDGSVAEEQIKNLMDLSYELTKSKVKIGEKRQVIN